jgi:hypothetical protein
MFFLKLGLRFKTFHLVSSLIGHEQLQLLKNMTKNLYYIYIIMILHPLFEYERCVVKHEVEKDRNLDNFEMTTSTNELATELINR